MTFDDHLSPHQDIDHPRLHFLQDLLMGASSRSRIARHPPHPTLRKEGLNLLLQAFGSHTDTPKSMTFTLRTVSGRRDAVIAVVALKRTVSQMKREGHAAVRTLKGEPTIRTEEKIG